MLSQQEMKKIQQNSLESLNLGNDMKSTAVDEKLRALNTAIRKLLAKKDAKIEIFVMKGSD
jgi:hypothetical protein